MKRYLVIVAGGILETTAVIIAMVVWYNGAMWLLSLVEQKLRLGWTNGAIENLSWVFTISLGVCVVVSLFIYADEKREEKDKKVQP